MDKLTMYRDLIQEIFVEYSRYKYSHGDIERELIVDAQRNHFELISVGWDRGLRVHGVVLHVDIRNGKIWVQHDGTEEGIANRLVELGVPKKDIVLAWQLPAMRAETEFAVA